MRNIEQMSSAYPELPLILKIGAYRRHLMMSSFGKDENHHQQQGLGIIKALHLYKKEIDPNAFKNMDFNKFISDPMGKSRVKQTEN